jgi:two-component system sensor histidine kinase PilS (NtrC family)
MSSRTRRLGLRREVLILLPTAVLLLMAVAGFTLLSFRGAMGALAEERRLEAERQARRLAVLFERSWPVGDSALATYATGLTGLLVSDAEGRRLAAAGVPPPPLPGPPPAAARAVGPSRELGGTIVAEAPFVASGQRLLVRLALPADALWTRQRALALWAPLGGGLGLAVALLVLLFLRPLLAPYETLLREARAAGLVDLQVEDEIGAMVDGFRRAAAAEAAREREGGAAVAGALDGELQAGLMLLDPAGRLLALNPAGAELLGIAAAPGMPLAQALAPHPELAARLAGALASGEAIARAEVPVRAAGESLTLGLAVYPLRRADGSRRGLLALFSDLTRFVRSAAERQLAAGLAQLGELSAGVAHELRNGLATLGGYLELLAEESDPGASADYRRELERETAHLARVVDDFLAFARPGRARVEPADLGALLTALAAEPTVQDLGVTLRLPVTPPPPLPADRPLLARALGNLLRNAAEAQRASGRAEPLEIELAAGAGEWEVRIGDRGAGVPEEVRARLFQPFVSGRPGGTGLGLALAQRLVALHGGAVRLEPRAGGGTHAVVAFPVGAFVTERLDPERTEAPESLRREEANPLS